MALRLAGEFIGEASLYAFDGKGCAEFAIRLLPDFQGQGLGTQGCRALMLAAKKMGLLRLGARIMKENRASLAMLRKLTESERESEGYVYFTVDL